LGARLARTPGIFQQKNIRVLKTLYALVSQVTVLKSSAECCSIENMTKTDVQEKARIFSFKPLKVGDIVEGFVLDIGRSAVYVDLGPQGTGVIYGREFMEEKTMLRSVKPGDKITAKIVDLENEKGYVELSVKEAGREITWDTLKLRKASEEVFPVKIIGANKGGLLAELNGIQAFLPVSQLSQEHYPRVEDGDATKILRALQSFMGKDLEVQIFDLDPKEEKIILSERSKERSKVKEMLAAYSVGDVVEGVITGVVDFGAFVKFPSKKEAVEGQEQEQIEGLIHISEIDWQIIEDPAQFLKVEDKVKAKIVDLSQGRASLSLKALKEDPWKRMEGKHAKGDIIEGKVTKINPFGAFVEVEPQIQGLCHISEFTSKQQMEGSIEEGQPYKFQILEITPAEHRMSLRLVTETSPSDPTSSASDTAKEAQS